jgi:hypothetical protein
MELDLIEAVAYVENEDAYTAADYIARILDEVAAAAVAAVAVVAVVVVVVVEELHEKNLDQ